MASILLVDDDYDASAALGHLLRKSGHDVRHVGDGREALAAVVSDIPDLMILDLRLPVMGGLDALAVIRSYHRLSAVPVILFTGYFDESAHARAERLGVRKVFVKGRDDWGELLAWVDQHTRQHPPEQPPFPQREATSPPIH
jgi:CheY-like chemotaxis protein